MKYYIEHCEVSRTTSYWEVEASSYDEAVQKLLNAKGDYSSVSDLMFLGDDSFDVEDTPIQATDVLSDDDFNVLSDYVDEDE